MSQIVSVDIIADFQNGDCGKGKVSGYLSSIPSRASPILGKNKKHYDVVARWGGGQNAGHTIHLGGKKYKTHMVPAGVFHGITSLIGPGCVVNLELLKEELSYLGGHGFDISLVKISPAAYYAKYARTGTRFETIAKSDPFWKPYLFDGKLYGNILCEGAQGFFLDINWGGYPYVTSSETLPYAACSIGFSPKKIRNIYAVAKIYDTRSGEDKNFPDTLFDNPELALIGDIGQEYGTTTGRRRKVNFLNLDRLIFALNTGGGNHLIISKCDILEQAKIFRLFYHGERLSFISLDTMKEFITDRVMEECSELEGIYYSHSPETVEGLSLQG